MVEAIKILKCKVLKLFDAEATEVIAKFILKSIFSFKITQYPDSYFEFIYISNLAFNVISVCPNIVGSSTVFYPNK